MFIFLFYFLFNMKLTFSTLIIQDAGIYNIENDDIAMIFFLTVENSYDHEIKVSVQNIKCIEGDPYLDTSDHMLPLGGNMGSIRSKRLSNLTLIYPNLYLRNLVGKCLISLHFEATENVEEVRKEIFFESARAVQPQNQEQRCSSYDLDGLQNCLPVDCVVKYSSRRSHYNKERRVCQGVPECPPNSVYIPKSNTCRKLHVPVCKTDLEMIEDGYVERTHSVSNLVNYRCHHGTLNNRSGECFCDAGWTTTTCSSGAYHPTLNLHHMCNVEINSWEEANRKKVLMTVLVLVIMALAVAAKMLLAVCLLNWCCQFIKSKRKDQMDECSSDNCPYSYCGDEECPTGENKSSRTIRVSFSNIDTISSGGETDVTVDVDEEDGKTESTAKSSRSTINMCHCKRK